MAKSSEVGLAASFRGMVHSYIKDHNVISSLAES